jgi:hypothetical protein
MVVDKMYADGMTVDEMTYCRAFSVLLIPKQKNCYDSVGN